VEHQVKALEQLRTALEDMAVLDMFVKCEGHHKISYYLNHWLQLAKDQFLRNFCLNTQF
jgi:hypothetical protein